jgi:hypothetical protein
MRMSARNIRPSLIPTRRSNTPDLSSDDLTYQILSTQKISVSTARPSSKALSCWRPYLEVITASLQQPFNYTDPSEVIKATRRTEDNVPDYVKGEVLWHQDPDFLPGYYLYDYRPQEYRPVEFLDNHWHYLFHHQGSDFISLSNRIKPHTQGTGYWRTTDPEHPNYNWFELLAEPSTSTAPTLTVDT